MSKKWLDKQEILAMLPISQMTWERWVKAGKTPPYTRIGRVRFWDASEFYAWMDANKMKSA
jgi:predicted DNA-binding transcriptional regulator AlpA